MSCSEQRGITYGPTRTASATCSALARRGDRADPGERRPCRRPAAGRGLLRGERHALQLLAVAPHAVREVQIAAADSGERARRKRECADEDGDELHVFCSRYAATSRASR